MAKDKRVFVAKNDYVWNMECHDMRKSNIGNFGYGRSVSIFGYNKTINAILIQCAIDSTMISASDSLVLQNIACLDPIIFGSAVYQARAILDIDEGSCASGTRSMQFDGNNSNNSESNMEAEEIRVALIPNPNNGGFKIATELEVSKLELLDLTGKIVYSQNQNSESYYETGLARGTYLVRINFVSGEIKVLKIEIN